MSWAGEEKDRGRKWERPGRTNEGLHFLWPSCSEHSVPHCGQFTLFFFLPLSPFHSFHLPLPPSFSVLLSHWDGSHVLWRPWEMKPHTEAVAGGRRRRRLQKKLGRRSGPRHQPATKLDVVKLSNYLRKLQQNLRRRKTERQRRVRSPLCCTTKWYLSKNLWF